MPNVETQDPAAVAPGIPPPENKVFYPALDGLRAFAALVVFFHHYLRDIPGFSLPWGWSGVDIFFVLSGFLITGILYDTRHTNYRFRNFYARRSLRIFPLYYAIFALALLLTPVLHWQWQHIWLLWPLYLGNYSRFIHPQNFFLFNGSVDNLNSLRFGAPVYFGHFWSLCVEEQFYLVWPFIVFGIRDRVRLRNLCVAVILALPLIRILLCFLLPPTLLQLEPLYRLTPLRADALLIGAALALMLRGPEAPRVPRLALPLFAGCLGFLALAWWTAVSLLHRPDITSFNTPWMGGFGFTLVDLAAAGLLLLALRPGNLVFRIFNLRPLRRLGQVSYGFYVFHDLPHVFYRHLVRTLPGIRPSAVDPVTAALALVCTIALAFLSFRFFEAPFLRLKDRFTI